MEKISIFKMDYNEFDRLVNKNYPDNKKGKYEIIPLEELNNYSCKLYEAINGEIEEWDIDEVKDLNSGKDWPEVSIVLNDLCKKGIIESGNYLIKIYW